MTERQPPAELATHYQLTVAQISRWKLQLREPAGAAAPATADLEPLYTAIGKLQVEMEKAICYDELMHKFRYRGLADTSIFCDENNLRFIANYRDKFARLANAYLAAGDVAKARQVADKCLEVMPEAAVPYDFYTPMRVPALVAGGEQAKANELMDRLTARSSQVINYYKTHDESLFDDNERQYLYLLQSVV